MAAGGGRQFWLHVDLDVLSVEAFRAHDFPEPGGIRWDDLRAITTLAVSEPSCAGWSVVIYNPDLDVDREAAGEIVDYIAGSC